MWLAITFAVCLCHCGRIPFVCVSAALFPVPPLCQCLHCDFLFPARLLCQCPHCDFSSYLPSPVILLRARTQQLASALPSARTARAVSSPVHLAIACCLRALLINSMFQRDHLVKAGLLSCVTSAASL